MDITTAQFFTWTIFAFVAGMAAGIGGVALWVYRSISAHDATEGDY